ncbi:hypothetical protein PT974_01391 [Cladobotryum mycophilum]|uniref:GAT domain-containing protein n=1 Tax=Cladobotryum mycophilum TaxID=491253 RepID=A0ABR0T4P5_9HYPO
MKSMKGLSMNKIVGSIKKKTGGGSDDVSVPAGSGETPEVIAHNNVKAFCESGGNAKTDEVLFLPPIVDAAESSPTAAAECARLIRKYLGKDYTTRPSWQYNAIMLMRILGDNPGPTFTRNMDTKFVDAIKSVLKNTKDPSVRQILMETLDDFERTKAYDENLGLLIQMWLKEKDRALREHGGRVPPLPQRPPHASPPNSYNNGGYSQNYFSRHHHNLRLPDPIELSSRLEEARTSAKLLEQVVMNTPPGEMLENELIKEFANRCLSASRSIQGYMVSNDPAPDNDTMESLIDTNEQLQTALSQHQRAVLNARKHLGLNERSQNPSPAPHESMNGFHGNHEWQNPNSASSSSGPPHSRPPPAGPSDPGRGRAPPSDPPSPLEDPFKDPQAGGAGYSHQRLADEPFHPGFGSSVGGGFAEHHGGSASGVSTPHGAGSSYPAGGQSAHQQVRGEVSDDDDIYDSTPKRKEPMYRY